MDKRTLSKLLEEVQAGRMEVEQALTELNFLPFAEAGDAKVDHHREQRCGFAEAVYGPGKTPDQTAKICVEILAHAEGAVLVTRASHEQFRAVLGEVPEAKFYADAKIIVARSEPEAAPGVVLIASAGTADLPVSREATVTLEALGIKTECITDVGIAGLHRLLSSRQALDRADVIIAVAGMEGALPTVVAGMVAAPVVAVPTSVGYGAGAGGIAPLLTMLNSCAPGVAVVNIDNGFGAAVFAASILRRFESRL